MLGHESVIAQVRVRATHAINFFALARAKNFVGVEARVGFKQALTAQNFLEAGDATGEAVRR